MRFSNSSHSKAVSVPSCGGSYWTSFITISPSFEGLVVGDGVGVCVGVSLGVGLGVGVGVSVGDSVDVGICVGVGVSVVI